jgi:hypothetical protein
MRKDKERDKKTLDIEFNTEDLLAIVEPRETTLGLRGRSEEFD